MKNQVHISDLDKRSLKGLKMLPLPIWVRWSVADDELTEDVKVLDRTKYGVPCMDRDGWFYNRYTRFSWFELNGVSYHDPYTEGFHFELRMLNASWYRENEYKALKLLAREHILTKPLQEQLRDYEYMMDNRQISRTTRQFSMSIFR